MWPIPNPKVDQEFNAPNSYGAGKPHEGLDMSVSGTWGNQDCGTLVKCIYDGEVVHSFNGTRNYGNMVVVESSTPFGTIWTRYCHLDQRSVNSGLVKRGDEIGTLGSTGNSTACHLHLDCLKKKPTNWRDYYTNVLEWYINPRKLIEADIIESDMPDYLKGLLADQLDIDVTESEGDVRGRVGEITDKLRNYDDLQKQIKGLEKEVSGYAAEAAKYEEELRLSIKSRDRLEAEVENIKRELVTEQTKLAKRDETIEDLQKQIDELKESIDPESKVVISKDEYERLQKRKRTDRLTDSELIGAWFNRKWQKFINIFKRGD